MKPKLRDQVFGFDADGQPVAGTVSATDGDRVRVTPTFYAPVWVPANRCVACPPPMIFEAARMAAAEQTATLAQPPAAAPAAVAAEQPADSGAAATSASPEPVTQQALASQ